MKFWSIDLHVSVIADIKDILESFGHTVINRSISGHHHIFNWDLRGDYVITNNNWRNLSKEMCDAFYERHKDELSTVDAFIVTHTPSFVLLYERFNKPIIVVASTRYEAPFSNDPFKWTWLNRYLQRGVDTKKIILVANNKYDQAYVEHFLGEVPALIPNYCDYTNALYSGTKKEELIYIKNKFFTPGKGMHYKESKLGRNYSWSDLTDHTAVIHFPYNVSTMSIFEQYASNMPMYFPTKRFLLELMSKGLALSEISWNQVERISSGSKLISLPNDPNLFDDMSVMKKWIEFSDFYDLPYLIYFDNIDDLLVKAKESRSRYQEISNLMQAHNVTRKKEIYDSWKIILKEIK